MSSSLYLNPPTYTEVHGILNSLNIKTSTGPDDIPPHFIKIAASVLTPYLVFFVSMSFKLGIFPTCLKTAKVIPVYKKVLLPKQKLPPHFSFANYSKNL